MNGATGQTVHFVDDHVIDFQAINNNLVYVLGVDRNLWREWGNKDKRQLVDSNVWHFQAIDENRVFVLGTDTKLWREYGTGDTRDLVDDDIWSFWALDSNLVYAKGHPSAPTTQLFRVEYQFFLNEWSRSFVDDNVLEFQPMGGNVVYVMRDDHYLWREFGDFHNRQLVDSNVGFKPWP